MKNKKKPSLVLWSIFAVGTISVASFAVAAPRAKRGVAPPTVPTMDVARALANITGALRAEGDAPGGDVASAPRPSGGRRLFATSLGKKEHVVAYVVPSGDTDAMSTYHSTLIAAGFEARTTQGEGVFESMRARLFVTARPIPEGTLLTIVEV